MGAALARWTGLCVRHSTRVLCCAVVLAAVSLAAAAALLGVTTDTAALFSADLPWRQRGLELERGFPQNENLLVAVVDAPTPEEAEATAASLAAVLAPDTVHFKEVRRPDASPFLMRNGLLFLDKAQLGAVLDQTVDAQPFLGQLAADPSLRGLMAALSLIAEGVGVGQANLAPFEASLRGFHVALAQAAAAPSGSAPPPLSWQQLLAGPVAELAGPYRFVLIQPRLDYGALEPGAAATDVVRDAVTRLEFVLRGRAHVRLTGSVALEDEEFATVAQGALAGLLGSTVLVAILLYAALRSWRLIVPVLLTLMLGLLVTTGFAAVAVGTLNLVSVAFAVLFVGIAVDFAIQLTVRFREERLNAPSLAGALDRTARRAGRQVLVAAGASAAGFLAFTPTAFSGVAQLGLVAGVGMLIAFACTVTVLPALLQAFNPRSGVEAVGLAVLRPLDGVVTRFHWPIIGVFAALGVAGLVSLPWLTFDSDPLHTKDPTTEAVRTLYDLMEDPVTNPYTMEVLAPTAGAALQLATRLRALPLVGDVLTVGSFVPEDQADKLPLVADAAQLLRTTLNVRPVARPTLAELRRSVQDAAGALGKVPLPPGSTIALIAADLQALSQVSDPRLAAADRALTRFLPLQLDRLRQALDPVPSTIADVPPDVARDWVLPDGRAKVQVIPKRGTVGGAGLRAFVVQVQTVAPDAAGSAATIMSSADTVVGAFRSAALLAVLAITALLGVSLRRVQDVSMVLAPLLLSSLLTVLIAVLLPLPLNFANIIALPLLLGVGVSFNIYFVMNWRAGSTAPLKSATARAVVFSAFTTATAFGSLALSAHPGTASMGALLLLSLGCTLVVTLVFLPALLAVVPRR